MTLSRVFRAAQRHLTSIYRDRRTLPTFVLVPLALTLLVGWVLRDAERDTAMAIVVEGDHWAVTDIASYFEESLERDGIDVRRASLTDAEGEVRRGQIDGYVVVNEGLAAGVLNGEAYTLRLGLRGDDLGASSKIRDGVERALVIAPLQVLRKATEGPRAASNVPVTIDKTYVFTDDRYETFDHLAPALLGFIIFLSIFTSALVAMSRERSLHTVERLLGSPLRHWQIIAGPVIGYLVIAIGQAVVIALTAIFALDIKHTGTIAEAVAISAVLSVAASTIGLFLSGFARSESEAMQLLPIILVPQSILCGVIFPVSMLPEFLQIVSRALPLTYGIEALRDLMLRDQGLLSRDVLTNLGVLAAFAAAFLVLAVRELKPAE